MGQSGVNRIDPSDELPDDLRSSLRALRARATGN